MEDSPETHHRTKILADKAHTLRAGDKDLQEEIYNEIHTKWLAWQERHPVTKSTTSIRSFFHKKSKDKDAAEIPTFNISDNSHTEISSESESESAEMSSTSMYTESTTDDTPKKVEAPTAPSDKEKQETKEPKEKKGFLSVFKRKDNSEKRKSKEPQE